MSAVHQFERAGLGVAPFKLTRYEKLVFIAGAGAPVQPGSTCDFCGTSIMHVYFISGSDPSDKEFKVGSECVKKTGDLGLRVEVRRARKALQDKEKEAARAARREKKKAEMKEEAEVRKAKLYETIPDLKELLSFHDDIRQRFEDFGFLSDRQLEFLRTLKRRKEEAALQVPVPEFKERTIIEGIILSTRHEDGPYGSQLKCLLKVPVEGGGFFKLWGTVPSLLIDIANGAALVGGAPTFLARGPSFPLAGCRVQFKAKVERSQRDPLFGFFSRPTSPKLISRPTEEPRRVRPSGDE